MTHRWRTVGRIAGLGLLALLLSACLKLDMDLIRQHAPSTAQDLGPIHETRPTPRWQEYSMEQTTEVSLASSRIVFGR